MSDKNTATKLDVFFYCLEEALKVRDDFVKEYGELTVRKVCMDEAMMRIKRFCKQEGVDTDRARRMMEGYKSAEQTDDFDGNPLTVV